MGKFWKSCRICRERKNSSVDYRSYTLTWQEYFTELGKTLILLFALCFAFYRSFLLFLFCIPPSLIVPFFAQKTLQKKRQDLLLFQFKEMLSILSSFLSAGYSIENALTASIPDLSQLIGAKSYMVEELMQIQRSLTMNRPLEESLSDFANRSGLDDIHNFSEIFLVAKRSGGELSSIIQHSSSIIHDKLSIREEILTLSAAKRFEQKIMNCIPFFIILYLNASSPEFFHILYDTIPGRCIMSFALLIYLLAIYLARKIIAIPI
ncbi:MAG: type II secretion system F family protein [Lachnospiraceae bacterium]|nr:type II secretion system F family protein [Lachnospiraceae bacterium]